MEFDRNKFDLVSALGMWIIHQLKLTFLSQTFLKLSNKVV